MNRPSSITVGKLLSVIERLHPDSLLLVRNETGLDESSLQELWEKVCFSFDPERRLATIEYLLLVMNDARQLDAKRYIKEVFLPFSRIRLQLRAQVTRITDDIARCEEIAEGTREDAAHSATKIYRPLVADIFDPYMTLLVATYQFIDGSFASITEANLGFQERNKAELVEARIKKNGGPTGLLYGYDPIVRNALSHAGSDGVVYEDGSILFRNIKRGSPPTVEARRWTHDELHLHIVALIELIMSIDGACEVFALDSMDTLIEDDLRDGVVFHAMTREQRLEIIRRTDERLEHIRTSDKLDQGERLELLAEVLFMQCGERKMPCSSIRVSQAEDALIVVVPISAAPEGDVEMRNQAMALMRYLIVARAVFGKMFERFISEAVAGEKAVMTVEVPVRSLDEYAAEQAGLVDLLSDAIIEIRGGRLVMAVDDEALTAFEDAALEPALPRRRRRLSD